jgi:hypothetical protein
MSGVVGLMLGISLRVGRSFSETINHWSDVPDWLFICVGVFCLFWAGYAAWRTEHRELEQLKSKELFLANCPLVLMSWSGIGDVPIRLRNVGKQIAHRVQFVKFQNGVEWNSPITPTIGVNEFVDVPAMIHEEISPNVGNLRPVYDYLRKSNLPVTITLTFLSPQGRHLTQRFSAEGTGVNIGFFALPLDID